MSAAVPPPGFVIPVPPSARSRRGHRELPGSGAAAGLCFASKRGRAAAAPRPRNPRDGQVRGPGMFPTSALLPWLSPCSSRAGAGPAVPSALGAKNWLGSGAVAGPADPALAGKGWEGLVFVPGRCCVQPPLVQAAFSRKKKMASKESFHQRAYVEQQGPAGRMSAFLEEAGGCQSDLFSVNESDLVVSRRS